jgi:hypothetical protein
MRQKAGTVLLQGTRAGWTLKKKKGKRSKSEKRNENGSDLVISGNRVAQAPAWVEPKQSVGRLPEWVPSLMDVVEHPKDGRNWMMRPIRRLGERTRLWSPMTIGLRAIRILLRLRGRGARPIEISQVFPNRTDPLPGPRFPRLP